MMGKNNPGRKLPLGALLAVGLCTLWGACGPSATFSRLPIETSGTGGAVDGGGTEVGGGTGGKAGSGGASGTGGMIGTGGIIGTGGVIGAGGNGGSVGVGGAAGMPGGGGRGGAGPGGLGGSAGGAAGRGAGGAGGRGGAGGGFGGAGGSATARFDFEMNTQGWLGATDAARAPFTTVGTSTAQHFSGTSALAGTVSLPAGATSALLVPLVAPAAFPAARTTVTYRVFVPTTSLVDWVQPFVQEVAPSLAFTPTVGGVQVITAATRGIWLTFRVVVPPTSVTIGWIGIEFHAPVAWSGTVYVDTVTW